MIPDRKAFQKEIGGQQTDLYVLQNEQGTQVAITNYGGRVVSIIVADRDGNPVDVVAGYDSLDSYRKKDEPYFGAIIGRYGNRIAHGSFSLNGTEFQLEINDPPNSLHGGSGGFHSRVWNAVLTGSSRLELSYRSPDGEEGYPGNLDVKVVYTLTTDNALKIEYEAHADRPTVINLTNHTYFNLNGESENDILNHRLLMNADLYVPIDSTSIPMGDLEEVEGTPFDFRTAKEIGEGIHESENVQMQNGHGYDHTFVLNHPAGTLGLAAVVTSPVTDIVMEVLTTEPGVQFYSGNFLNGRDQDGKNGTSYPLRSAFCLETQHFPDSPNHPHFPSTTLNPGEEYHSTTIYRFSGIG